MARVSLARLEQLAVTDQRTIEQLLRDRTILELRARLGVKKETPSPTRQRNHYALLETTFGAHNYEQFPGIVLCRARDVFVGDTEGRRYLDMLGGYSALNQGHLHPRIVAVAKMQLGRITLTTRAFLNDRLGPFEQLLCEVTGMQRVLPMNSGAEAVETAIKLARRWGHTVKGVPRENAEIIVFDGNFHGRTTTVISFSTRAHHRDGFGPHTPGFVVVPFGDAEAVKKAITPNTVAILAEPIQGQGGIVVPPEGFFKEVAANCKAANVLLIADEIQTGLGRTGRMFAYEHEGIKPDVLILGKALGGGIVPISAVASSSGIMDAAFDPDSHGSTFGGNPLAAAVATAALEVLITEELPERARIQGNYFKRRLEELAEYLKRQGNNSIVTIRGRGLLLGIELREEVGLAKDFCGELARRGLLTMGTHAQKVIRLAPPLTIAKDAIDQALVILNEVFSKV